MTTEDRESSTRVRVLTFTHRRVEGAAPLTRRAVDLKKLEGGIREAGARGTASRPGGTQLRGRVAMSSP
jgi:hypothetical protein